jgi:hypothetical protein
MEINSTRESEAFRPIALRIVLNTQEEFDDLYARLHLSPDYVNRASSLGCGAPASGACTPLLYELDKYS